jgi:hypothetical protein
MEHYLIKFVSDIQQIDGFLRGHIVESGVKHHNHNHIKYIVGCRGRDRMVVGFKTAYGIGAYHR